MSLVAYTARWLIDGIQNEPIDYGVVVVEGRQIVDIGSIPVPTSAERIDLGQATLLPGLIDCHVHLPFDASADPVATFKGLSIPSATLIGLEHAQMALRKGITTVRDVSTPFGISTSLRDAINAGHAFGPTIVAAGTHICMTGGHASSIGIEVDGPHEMRKAVRAQLKAGADVIKVMGTGGVYSMGHRETPDDVQLGLDELLEAAGVAHAAGRKVAVHAEGSEGIRLALEAGIDTIEHGNMLTLDLAERMAAQSAFLIPTVGAFINSAKRTDAPAEYLRNAARLARASESALQNARKCGVQVACGTDRGTVSYMSWTGDSLVDEMRFMVELGEYQVMEAVKAATVVGAKALDLKLMVGTLEAGKNADVLAASGNILQNLDALHDPLLVLKNGIVVVGPQRVMAAL